MQYRFYTNKPFCTNFLLIRTKLIAFKDTQIDFSYFILIHKNILIDKLHFYHHLPEPMMFSERK